MKASELRIGNLVDSPRGIESISDAESLQEIESYPEKFKPIPLTEEWLLKFGFEIDNGLDKRYRKENDHIEVGLRYIKSIKVFKLGFIGTEIKYVHQLQNLYFALTGEELIINL